MRAMPLLKLACLLAMSAGATQPAQAGKADDTLNFAATNLLQTLDPMYSPVTGVHKLAKSYLDGLVDRDPLSLEIRPLLATSWKVVEPTLLEFKLREDVTFHNGERFDADDVVYTVKYLVNPENKLALASTFYGFLKDAEKVDPYTVRIRLANADPSALERLAVSVSIYPDQYHKQVGKDVFATKPVGTGPYKVVEFSPGGKLVMARNDKYFDAPWGKPKIGRIVYWPIVDTQTQVAEMIGGKLDMIYRVPADQAEGLATIPNLQVVQGDSIKMLFMSFDATGRSGPSPVQDVRVRQAIGHAIDRKSIAKNLIKGTGDAATAVCHPLMAGCSTEGVKGNAYDPARAKALLAEAGFPNGLTLQVSGFGPENLPLVEAVMGDLRKVGINIDLDFGEVSGWAPKFFAGKLSSAIVAWSGGGIFDASTVMTNSFGGGAGDYTRDAEVTEWVKAAGATYDRKIRDELYGKALRKIAEQAYVQPLFSFTTFWVVSKDVALQPPKDGEALLHLVNWK